MDIGGDNVSKKVKITKEQANAIEWARNETSFYSADINLIKTHLKVPNGWLSELKGLNGMDEMLLIDALRHGYEVEKSIYDSKYFYYDDTRIIGEFKNHEIYWSDGMKTRWSVAKQLFENGVIEHITEEKFHEFKKKDNEKKLWSSINREVGEFKIGDVFLDRVYGSLAIDSCSAVDSEFATKRYEEGEVKGFYPVVSYIEFDDIKK